METLKITLHFDESRKADVLKQLEALDLGDDGRVVLADGNGAAFDGLIDKWKNRSLKREELLELSAEELAAYCATRGGVFVVMKAHGFGLSAAAVDDWNAFQLAEQAEWEKEYERRYGRPFPR